MAQFGNCKYANAEIKRLFLTPWSGTVIPYIDEDYIITSLTGLTDEWSEIVINTVTVTYEQSLNPPNPNGINYTESINIFVPHADVSKWLDLVNILEDRYMLVFQDANDQWFLMGWRFGTKVETYNVEENQLGIGFINSFSNSLLASINESYVTSNIL